MVGPVFVINAKDWASPVHYTISARFDILSGSYCFSDFAKILDLLKYVDLCKFALRINIEPILTALAINQP